MVLELVVAGSESGQPSVRGSFRTTSIGGGFVWGPVFVFDALAHQDTLIRGQSSIPVECHGSPCDESGFSTLKSRGGPTDQRGWDLHLADVGRWVGGEAEFLDNGGVAESEKVQSVVCFD